MSDHAKIFHALHQGPSPLILANAWDAGSARGELQKLFIS